MINSSGDRTDTPALPVRDHVCAENCRERWEDEKEQRLSAAWLAQWHDPTFEFGHASDGRCVHVKGSGCCTWEHALQPGLLPPTLMTRQMAWDWMAAARGRRRCRVCCPDIVEPPPRPRQPRRRRTGLGWPLADGRCARRAADIDRVGSAPNE